jgi:MFS family permease
VSESRRRLWRILLPLCIGAVLSLAGDLTLYTILPANAAQRSVSMGMVGLLLSANRLVRLGSNPLVGLLLNGARRRGFVLAGFGLGAISTLLYVLAGDDALFLIGRLLWGISWSLINIGSYCMLLDAAGEQDRGWGSGVLQSFIFIGMALNPLLGGLLSDRFGFTSALAVCAAIQAAGFLIALFTLPETLADSTGPRPPFAWAARGALLHWRARLSMSPLLAENAVSRLRLLLNSHNARQNAVAYYIYFAANFIGDGILLSTLSLYLQTHFGSAIAPGGAAGRWIIPVATASGALLALRAVVAALVAPLAGHLSDHMVGAAREPSRPSLPHHRRWQAIAWGVFLGAAGLLVIVGLRNPWALLAGVALAASGSAIVITVAPPLVREINPAQESGAFLGLLATSADLGTALAPLATYALLDRLPLDGIYGLAALALGLGLPLVGLASTRPAAAPASQNPTSR